MLQGRHGKVWSYSGAKYETVEQADTILRAVQSDIARGTPPRQADERWLPTNSRAHRVSRGLAEWIDDLESQVMSGDRSGNYVR